MSLAITYTEIRREIGRFLAIGEVPTNWNADDTLRVADIIRRGSRRFYFPETSIDQEGKPVAIHNWSFIQNQLSLALIADTLWHSFPAEFIRLTERPTIEGAKYPLEEISDGDMRGLINAGPGEGSPQYYTVKRSTSGSLLYRIALHPVPPATTTLNGWYLFCPEEISAIAEPICPANHAETMMAAMLMAADEIMNYETHGKHFDRFKSLVLNSVALDMTLGSENNNANATI